MKSSFRPPASKTILFLAIFWLLFVLAIGIWWIYLLLQMNKYMPHGEVQNVANMLLWEGGFFLVMLLLLSATLIFFYLRSMRQTRLLQAFFLSLTHELKTPLASIRLQGEVLDETLGKDKQANVLIQRLLADTFQLENKMDKILQFSQIEREGLLPLEEVEIVGFIRAIHKKCIPQIALNITVGTLSEDEIKTLINPFAFELILRNLFENSQKHGNSGQIHIDMHCQNNVLQLRYRDGGQFRGEVTRLGELFYKSHSPKGTGIGLFLCRELMQKMKGSFIFSLEQNQLLQEINMLMPEEEIRHV